MTNDEEYSVGYKKPPKVTQFKQGESGNKKGRPKGARNFSTVIDEELNTRIMITENGKQRKISKRQAIAKQLVNKAASGDHKAIPILLNHGRNQESKEASGVTAEQFVSSAEEQTMASIIARLRRTDAVETAAESDSEETNQTNTNQEETDHDFNI